MLCLLIYQFHKCLEKVIFPVFTDVTCFYYVHWVILHWGGGDGGYNGSRIDGVGGGGGGYNSRSSGDGCGGGGGGNGGGGYGGDDGGGSGLVVVAKVMIKMTTMMMTSFTETQKHAFLLTSPCPPAHGNTCTNLAVG